MSTPSGRVERIGATQAVFERLKALVQGDDYAIGDRLPSELALAKEFGVSRPVVREALNACATLGLTQTFTGRGTFVTAKHENPDLSFAGIEARDLIEARPLIEIPTARFAAVRRTPADVARMRELLDRLAAAADTATWVGHDRDLHSAIARACGNAMLQTVVRDTRRALDLQSELLDLTQDRRAASDREHRAIVEAIAAGDEEAAGRAMAEHLSRVADAVSRIGHD